MQSKWYSTYKRGGWGIKKIIGKRVLSHIDASFKLIFDTIERTGGWLESTVGINGVCQLGLLGLFLGPPGVILPRTRSPPHLHIVFLESVQTGAHQLLTRLGWTGTVVGLRLFLDKGINGAFGFTYFPVDPLKIAAGIILLKTRQKHTAWVLGGLAQLHSWSKFAMTLEGAMEESLVDGGVDFLTKLNTYILTRI